MAKVYSFPWHNDNCVRKNEYVDERDGRKRFFCVTHNQWASEVPVKKEVIFTYGDGSDLHIVRERKHE